MTKVFAPSLPQSLQIAKGFILEERQSLKWRKTTMRPSMQNSQMIKTRFLEEFATHITHWYNLGEVMFCKFRIP
jgi:hypothetical protein